MKWNEISSLLHDYFMNHWIYGLRIPNEAFFRQNPKVLGLCRQFWGIWGIFGQFIGTRFGTVSPLSMSSINQPLFTKLKIPNIYKISYKPNIYIQIFYFGIGNWIWICIWAAKNWGFRHLVSVVREWLNWYFK